MSAWQNTLMPPEPVEPRMELQARGRAVFEAALCHGCHAGSFLTNNGVAPEPTVGTGEVRAKALSLTEAAFVPPMVWPFDVMVPLPSGTKAVPVPTAHLNAVDARLAWGHGGTPGGYKVPALVGLAWSAPYLHDGGVPTLRAMLDRRERERAVARNRASPALVHQNITGAGHEFWVDEEAGYTRADQDALIHYLEMFDPPR
jgi:cytochrome c peroxidase